ncbi:MAG: alkyl sulfatase dimerization domain-containing protein [Acidobacteriota bacterium]
MTDESQQPKPATTQTAKANETFGPELDYSDRTDFELARRGLLATHEPMTIRRERDDKVVFDLEPFTFLDGDAPDTVNPSLWRQCQLNAQNRGLYEVTDGIYQLRGFDLANMTLVRGDTGWILIDPLTCAESSAAALALANEHLGERPVHAVIHTHSHADHFAGVWGVVQPEQVSSGEVVVLAPRDYVREALSENVMAGNVMNRRATFMFGNLLPPGPQGFVGNGLGPALSMGTTGFAVPTDTIYETGETRTIDGVEIEFQWTPGTEAPTEMVFFFPQFAALCMSEIASHHLHNVYTPRGALTRDALAWADQLQESLDLFGDRLEVQFGCHHWPIWGRDAARDYLEKQRDLYKFIHDQTLRLANHGFTKEEIAEQLRLPQELAREFYNRDYYGTVSHNSKAVYVRYLGYFDGHPSNLDPHPPQAAAVRYVRFMGGADRVLEQARESFDEGDYRWVAEVVNHVVFAEPENEAARTLLADALEQLGYQAESGPWRNFYLTGAQELRHGTPAGGTVQVSEGIARNMPLQNLYDSMAVRLNAEKAAGVELTVDLDYSDLDRVDRLQIANSVLHVRERRGSEAAPVTLRLDSVDFKRLMLKLTDAQELIARGALKITGDPAPLLQLGGYFDSFVRSFPILFPRAGAENLADGARD